MSKELRALVFAGTALLAGLAVYQAAGLFFSARRTSLSDSNIMPAPPAIPPPPSAPRPIPGKSYTNEELHARLADETQKDGITSLGPNQEEPSSPLLGEPLGAPGSRERADAMIHQLSAMRRDIESGKPKAVLLEGEKPSLLSAPEPGGGAGRPAEESASWSGSDSGGLKGSRAIGDAKAWRTLWSKLSRGPAPAVDFETRQVAAVFPGPRPAGGGSVEIVEVSKTASETVVSYRERAPLPSAAPREAPDSPYVLREIEKNGLPVRFDKVP